MNITTEVEGLAELEKALLGLGAELGFKTLRTAGRKAMKPVLADAEANIHVDSGDSKESLQITAKKGKGSTAVDINVGNTRRRARKSNGGHKLSGVYQAVMAQEFGTKKQVADPFLAPALAKNQHRVLNDFKTELRKAIDKAAKKYAAQGAK